MIRCKLPALTAALLGASMLSGPAILLLPVPAAAQVTISVQLEPPALPDYDQPPIPEPGYLWTPGYWAYDDSVGYYWVPGTWVEPPEIGLLWTPPYWGWSDGAYVFHTGYWGPHVGFYGGVNYGFGYGGGGYEGGRWDGGVFRYNSTVNNFGSMHITNVYQQNVTIINNTKVSYNGGSGGVKAQPTPVELQAEHEHHAPPSAVQVEHRTAAAKNPELAAKANNGHPAIAATAKPADFHGPGVVAAHGAPAHPAAAPAPAQHPEEHAAPGAAPHPTVPGAHPEEHPAPGALHPPLPNEHPEEHPTPGAAPHPVPPHPEEHAAPPPHPAAPRPEDHPAPTAPHPMTAPAPHEPPPPTAHPVERPAPAVQAPHPAAPPQAAPPQAAPHPAQKPPPKEEEKKPPQF